jgi:hypothetical protein
MVNTLERGLYRFAAGYQGRALSSSLIDEYGHLAMSHYPGHEEDIVFLPFTGP